MPPVIDGFTDLVEVGRGGFGTVFRARQVDPARDVAIKVLPDVRADSDAYGRFTREFQALASLGGHPNIARVHACGVTADGSGYLALELLVAGSLGDRLRAGAAPWAEVASWGVQLSGALETAHRAGITHRDIKPENVLFDAAGTPKLVDFGIAGVPGAYRTATGSVTLTLAHAAPEVVAGGRGGVPGDVYSLSSTLYAAIAGAAAFVADADETLVPMLARIATAPVPDLRPRGVPDSVCTALERGMAKDPADRPASAEALGMSLQAALAREGVAAAAPLLLLSPGVLAPFVISDGAPAIGTAAGTVAGVAEGDRTLTGWVAPGTAAAAADAEAEPARSARRRSGFWAAAASVAAVLALLLVVRGFDSPPPAAAGSGAGATSSPSASAQPTTPAPSASRTPSATSSASPTRKPSTTAPGGGSSFVLDASSAARAQSAKPDSSPTRSAQAPPTTRPAPSPSSTTPAPPPRVRPYAPQRVRVGGAAVVRSTSGAPAEVAVRMSWLAPTKAPAPSAYEVRYTVIGTTGAGATTLAATTPATALTITVPAPPRGTRYRWQVRAVLGAEGSAWATARAVVPQLVGRRAAQARTALRALGLSSSTYRLPVPAKPGRVVAQSSPRGRVLPVGSSIALGIGTVS